MELAVHLRDAVALLGRFPATRIGEIESEEFFDFTTTRPLVQDVGDGREIVWPDTELWAVTTGTGADLLVLVGHEPHLRWRTYCQAVVEAADEFDCSMVITLGALLSDVPHTRPTAVTGSSEDPDVADRLDLVRSRYEGPTGIVGVLHAACLAAGKARGRHKAERGRARDGGRRAAADRLLDCCWHRRSRSRALCQTCGSRSTLSTGKLCPLCS